MLKLNKDNKNNKDNKKFLKNKKNKIEKNNKEKDLKIEKNKIEKNKISKKELKVDKKNDKVNKNLNLNPNKKDENIENEIFKELKKDYNLKKTKLSSAEKKIKKLEFRKNIKKIKEERLERKRICKKYSKRVLKGEIISTQNYVPDTNNNIIELKNVVKKYITGEVETVILDKLDLKLKKGKFIVILGPSGSGKTTLLNLISGLDKANSGDTFVVGRNLFLLKDTDLTKFRRDNVGFIFQQYNLLTNLTARENAEVGENLANKKIKNWKIEEIFEKIDMKDQINKYPHQMSGGQQQRVSIARALAKNPNILFADEPTGALDEKTGRKVLDILLNINKELGTTIVLVTHNPNISKIADSIIHVLNGKIDKHIVNEKPELPSQIDWS